ncbi:hypothetical protein N7449_000061 [Penicillium cf. viridicatum]|uniref:Uncharacterized protein n=1 Tax=Penicillium cf. viridicatum TaxID=2972119 RepID=A0A9W9N456_9EURO|nr:hypothetical protein N7449_000061 [Penicillium cf. viridicatum]
MDKITKFLPWVFHGWCKPRTLEIDKGFGSWYECELQVTLDTTEGKGKKARKLEVLRIFRATPSVKWDKEFDLQVALWLKSEVLEELAPCLLEKHNRDPTGAVDFSSLPWPKKEAGMKSLMPPIPSRRSARIRDFQRKRKQDPLLCGV